MYIFELSLLESLTETKSYQYPKYPITALIHIHTHLYAFIFSKYKTRETEALHRPLFSFLSSQQHYTEYRK